MGMSEHAATPAARAPGQDAHSDADELFRCESLVIGHQGKGLLPPFDLGIRRGRVLLVVGPNGAGKSTWLKTVLGLIPPVSGKLHACRPAPRLAYVPQSTALDELLPVRAATVVEWGRLRGWSFLLPWTRRQDRHARVRALEQAGAQSFANQPFRDLSGGQRQRALMARLFAGEADLALLDEPTASMDASSERQAYHRLAELARTQRMAVVVVTHTISAAAEHADEVLFIDRFAGRHGGHGDHECGRPGDSDSSDGSGAVVAGPAAEVFADPLFKYHFGEVHVDG